MITTHAWDFVDFVFFAFVALSLLWWALFFSSR